MTSLKRLRTLIEFCIYILLATHLTPECTCSKSTHILGMTMLRSPESTVAPLGDEVLFECELNLAPDRLEWRFLPETSRGEKNDFIYINNKTTDVNITTKSRSSKLRVNVSKKSVGEYRCVVWYGSSALASVPAKLMLAAISLDSDIGTEHDSNGVGSNNGKIMRGISSSQQVVRWEIFPGNSVLIKCGSVKSNPSPVWNFYKDNHLVSSSVPQLQTGTLVLSPLNFKDSGTYWCSAVNTITGTEVTLPQRIMINVAHTSKTAPSFLTKPPNEISVKPGATVILECPGTGNPVPKATWSSPETTFSSSGKISNTDNRTTVLGYGLQIINVTPADEGIYFCRIDNGVAPPLVHKIRLQVLESPIILEGPNKTLTNESESLSLECEVKGSPFPEVYWMVNGDDTKWDPMIVTNGSKMVIKSVEKRHAGIVQCFAKNEVGEVTSGHMLQVNPKQIPGEVNKQPLGTAPIPPKPSRPKQAAGGHTKAMIPPSRPNVTRLSDESVMVRWTVEPNNGLDILFFKVQYRILADQSKNIQRSHWETSNEDISAAIRSYEVSNLKPDLHYRFRIAAVYSNNDNKLGNTSGKFLLQRGSELGPSKSHLMAPTLNKVEPVSENAIVLHWNFTSHPPNPVDGFYAYFRRASTAGEYSKATIDGMWVRKFKIDDLEVGTAYEFKLQSFTSSAASDFSAILTGITLKPTIRPSITPSVIVAASESSPTSSSMFPLIVGAAAGVILILLLTIGVCVCIKRRKKAQREEDSTENKSHPDHIQADSNGFPGGSPRVLSSPMHKQNRMNGVPRMNITPNPMAQESDKNRNVMELRFLPSQPAIVQQNNNCPPTPDPLRRTLERSARNIHHMGDSKMMSPEGDLGLGRNNQSGRRTRRTSGSGPGSPRIMRGGVSSELLQNRSPMPVRAAAGMKRGNRLGGRTENMSSGSLNSIEV